MIRLHDILDTVSAYNPDADLDIIRKAYVFAAKAHQGQIRKSGEPYLVHPLEVAAILANMKLDVASIAAAFLHDTVEDTVATIEEIEDLFGEEVKILVDGVSKLSKIHFRSSVEQQAENFRKMILAMAKDIRVIIIKLADRLHNMRTLQFMPESKQDAISQETLDIYAPIANRLGMQQFKVEFEDLALKYLKPDVYTMIDVRVREIKQKREKYISKVKVFMQERLTEHNLDADVSGRVKHYYSIWRKMERLRMPLEEVHDIIAFRIVVDTVPQCYEALGVVHALWRPVPGKFKDYIAMPKANSYRSLHTTIIGPDGERVEFQIKTKEMHNGAEYGIAAHWKYKEGKSTSHKDESKFTWLRRLLEWQKELSDSTEFLDTMKLDLFAEEVYVFTPRGDLIELPYGSTPLDFAYAIHTEVGHHCAGAKVNGRIVPLRYQLKGGDTIDILRGKNQRPHKDWLQFVVTSRAKAKIRQHLRLEEHDKSIDIGKELLGKECQRHSLNLNQVLKSKELKAYIKKSAYSGAESLIAGIGYGKVSPIQIVSLFQTAEEREEARKKAEQDTILGRIAKKIIKPKDVVKVGGKSGVLVNFANCCNPVPGDHITGYVTRGRGVTIHLRDCPRVVGMDPDRMIGVAWEDKGGFHMAKIRIVCSDKPRMLADMTEAIASQDANISGVSAITGDDRTATCIFELRVNDLKHLRSVMKSIEKIKGVISVERLRQ